MMSEKNKKIMQEVLVSIAAMDKLDKIVEYLNENETITKEDIFNIINGNDIDFME